VIWQQFMQVKKELTLKRGKIDVKNAFGLKSNHQQRMSNRRKGGCQEINQRQTRLWLEYVRALRHPSQITDRSREPEDRDKTKKQPKGLKKKRNKPQKIVLSQRDMFAKFFDENCASTPNQQEKIAIEPAQVDLNQINIESCFDSIFQPEDGSIPSLLVEDYLYDNQEIIEQMAPDTMHRKQLKNLQFIRKDQCLFKMDADLPHLTVIEKLTNVTVHC